MLENIEMGGYTLPRSKVRQRVEEVMELYQQPRQITSRQGGHLSGGERMPAAPLSCLVAGRIRCGAVSL